MSVADIETLVRRKGKAVARQYCEENGICTPHTDRLLKKRQCRSWSGVLVVTVVTRPDTFSCPFDCKYCPNEPGQPRSYLSSEPAVARANENNFDAKDQVYSRLNMLRKNGHTLNKIEIIVLGGTFSTYPRAYQEEFLRDVFYAANTYGSTRESCDPRERLSIAEEQRINETAHYRVIGISLETRPDLITHKELMRFRSLGCTRVQLGIQHTADSVLQRVNRGHDAYAGIKAIALLRYYGFKIDLHVMPDLPGSNPDMDKVMLRTILTSPDYSPDYLKIYPCLDVDFTEIREWKKTGQWKPYAEENGGEQLYEVCMEAKIHSQYHIRYNRIQRDFPEAKPGVLGFESQAIKSNFRQLLLNRCEKAGIVCKCIRCREVKGKALGAYRFFVDKYAAAVGTEYFISCESRDRSVLYGFVRLRIANETKHEAALVRELHVYGYLQNPGERNSVGTQHNGIGKQLMKFAEAIAWVCAKQRVLVISGVGVREYYRKLGYTFEPDGQYMVKCSSGFVRAIWALFVYVIATFNKNMLYT